MSSGHSYGSQGLDAGSVLHYLARVLCTWVFLVGEELRQSQRKPQSALQMGERLYPVLLSFLALPPEPAGLLLPSPGLASLSGLLM